MRALGVLLLLIGLAGLAFGLSMDTSVATLGGGRVNNIGLMNDKQNLLLVFAALSIVGALLAALSGRRDVNSSSGVSLTEDTQAERKCPYCAESIKAEAKLCRFCQKEVQPLLAAAQQHDDEYSVRGCVAKLAACGCKINHATGGGWEVTTPSGETLVARSAKELELLARKQEFHAKGRHGA